MNKKSTIFWFRRDLRLTDNAGLYQALKSGYSVRCIFIFDRSILDLLAVDDARVTFLYERVEDLKKELQSLGSDLEVYYGKVDSVWNEIMNNKSVQCVYANHDYEPYARGRDDMVSKLLKSFDIKFETFKDQVIFEKDEVVKNDGKPYTVFTPYRRKWLANLTPQCFSPYPTEEVFEGLVSVSQASELPTLSVMGFERSSISSPSLGVDPSVIVSYDQTRDFPFLESGTSRLGIHLRFGTISIRQILASSLELNDTYVSELLWREFYQQILWHFPQVIDRSFKPQYDKIEWRNRTEEFEKWCEGRTGYPMVDAGMRELNTTGYMHNRVRMVVASFLCKHLLIDWRWGERYFASKLLDYDLSANNGGWQWAAGTGCDAAPYFRVFNPEAQQKKFDPDFIYIKKWVPEFGTSEYPLPMVDHKAARLRALDTYKSGLSS